MQELIDGVIKKLERAERVIQVIDCLAELESFSEHERFLQVKAALAAYFRSSESERR